MKDRNIATNPDRCETALVNRSRAYPHCTIVARPGDRPAASSAFTSVSIHRCAFSRESRTVSRTVHPSRKVPPRSDCSLATNCLVIVFPFLIPKLTHVGNDAQSSFCRNDYSVPHDTLYVPFMRFWIVWPLYDYVAVFGVWKNPARIVRNMCVPALTAAMNSFLLL